MLILWVLGVPARLVMIWAGLDATLRRDCPCSREWALRRLVIARKAAPLFLIWTAIRSLWWPLAVLAWFWRAATAPRCPHCGKPVRGGTLPESVSQGTVGL